MEPWRRELFDRHRPVVAGMARDRCGGNHSIEDELEAAGLWGLWLAIETYADGSASFQTWARRRIGWAMTDWLRSSSHYDHHKTGGHEGLPAFGPLPANRPDTGPCPGHGLAVREELLAALRRAGLDAREQRVLVLRRAYGRSLADLAAHLGLTAPTVQRIEQLALAKLRTAFPDNTVAAPEVSMPKRAAPGRLDVWEYPEP